ncbi:MAG: CPBP family intramembrane glutamic endopeptidase [Lachnospiraceae bacterium]|nr:CPBP family intramembrane glutamic endopeptidase [Oribacterium sp.]MEE3393578.1 CPBP family intramembrane glutamic endopeptidase [Lachnospiraceae bacterium]MEE3462174.1 CPBP family intramembrane glutamic endopeptidase [Lachnospiraceae bacterium]
MKENIEHCRRESPVVFSVAAALVFLLILHFTRYVTRGISLPGYEGLLLREESSLILCALVLLSTGQYKNILWQKVNVTETLTAGIVLIVFDTLLLGYDRILMLEKDPLPWTEQLVFFSFVLLVGILEETVFRGIIEGTLLSVHLKRLKNPAPYTLRLFAALFSGMLFGFCHIINISWADNPTAIFIQMIQNVVIGIYFSLIYAYQENVIGMILLHTLYDFTSLFMSGIYGIGSMQTTVEQLSPESLWLLLIYIIPSLYLVFKIIRRKT